MLTPDEHAAEALAAMGIAANMIDVPERALVYAQMATTYALLASRPAEIRGEPEPSAIHAKRIHELEAELEQARQEIGRCRNGACDASETVVDALIRVGGWDDIAGDGDPAEVLADHIRELPGRVAEERPADAIHDLLMARVLVPMQGTGPTPAFRIAGDVVAEQVKHHVKLVQDALAQQPVPSTGEDQAGTRGMSGADRIARERARQIEAEGWTPEHDDQHEQGELATGAMCYALAAVGIQKVASEEDPLGTYFGHDPASGRPFPPFSVQWPWDEHWKPSDDPIRNLEKAGALIAAEIDRLLRLPGPGEGGETNG